MKRDDDLRTILLDGEVGLVVDDVVKRRGERGERMWLCSCLVMTLQERFLFILA